MRSDNKIHASCVAISRGAVLLSGPSGSGKSDLALRLIEHGARLVSDDQVVLTVKNAQLIASPPETIKGLLEIRDIGIVKFDYLSSCAVKLVIDLSGDIVRQRLPDDDACQTELLDVSIPFYRLDPFQASCVAKINYLMKSLASR